MLLDILSNGNRPWIVEKSINAMFQGVAKLTLSGDPAITVTHLVSNEGEEVELKKMKSTLRSMASLRLSTSALTWSLGAYDVGYIAPLSWSLGSYDVGHIAP